MEGPPPIRSKPGQKDVLVVRSQYSYLAQQEGELSFDEGQVLYVLGKQGDDWLLCKIGDKQGLVPVAYVGENTAQIDNPLHDAAKRGNVEFARELIENGVSLNGFDKARNAPIHWACRSGHIAIVKMLLAKNVVLSSQNKLGDTPLHLACWGGHSKIVELLLERNVDASIKNISGDTPAKLAKDDIIGAMLVNYMGSKGAQGMVGGDSDEEQ